MNTLYKVSPYFLFILVLGIVFFISPSIPAQGKKPVQDAEAEWNEMLERQYEEREKFLTPPSPLTPEERQELLKKQDKEIEEFYKSHPPAEEYGPPPPPRLYKGDGSPSSSVGYLQDPLWPGAFLNQTEPLNPEQEALQKKWERLGKERDTEWNEMLKRQYEERKKFLPLPSPLTPEEQQELLKRQDKEIEEFYKKWKEAWDRDQEEYYRIHPPPQIPDAEAGVKKGGKTSVPVKDEEGDKDEQYAVDADRSRSMSDLWFVWERERNQRTVIEGFPYWNDLKWSCISEEPSWRTWVRDYTDHKKEDSEEPEKDEWDIFSDMIRDRMERDWDDPDWWFGTPDEERIKDLERPEEPRVPDAIGPVVGPVLASALVDMGIVEMDVGGTGTTTGVVCSMHNNTPQPVLAILPAGTSVAPVSGDTQAYITAENTAFLLGPANTGSMLLEPYDFMLADARQSDPEALRLVAHGDAPAQTGPQNPPAAPGMPGPILTRQVTAYCTDMNREPAPAEASVKYAIQTGPITPQQELLTELIMAANILEDIHTLGGEVLEPDDLLISPRPPRGSGTGKRKTPEKSIDLNFKLSGPLQFPGTMEFVLTSEGGVLKTNVASSDEKGEIEFSNPVGKVDVAVESTDDPEIVRFNITKLTAQADPFDVFGKRKGDIHMTLHSPEKSTGFLNISTGEVSGTVSVEAWGKKYKTPFPAAAMYTGRFDFPTRKLSLSLNCLSFEPIELKPGLYQRTHPKKFWEAVHLYAIWKETNDVEKKKLKETMTEQLLSDFPEEQAKKYADIVANEIWNMVDKVEDLHEDLKDGGFDFSKFTPVLKRRKT